MKFKCPYLLRLPCFIGEAEKTADDDVNMAGSRVLQERRVEGEEGDEKIQTDRIFDMLAQAHIVKLLDEEKLHSMQHEHGITKRKASQKDYRGMWLSPDPPEPTVGQINIYTFSCLPRPRPYRVLAAFKATHSPGSDGHER